MNEIDSGGVGHFLQMEAVPRQSGLHIKPRGGLVTPRRVPLDEDRRDQQTHEDQRQNNPCCRASFHWGDALLSEF